MENGVQRQIGNVRNTALDNDMNANVPNPFYIANLTLLQTTAPTLYRYLSSQSLFTSNVIRRNVLLRAFPQIGTGTLTGVRPGSDFDLGRALNDYKDLQVQLEKRFSRGLQTTVLYTWSSQYIETSYMNEFDAKPVAMPATDTRPHRFVWSGIYEFPFGKGRKWLADNPLRHAVGDWQLSWICQYQPGPPLSWKANRLFYSDVNQLGDIMNHDAVHSADIHTWFDPKIAGRHNTVPPADFGRVTSQLGAPGVLQLNMRVEF